MFTVQTGEESFRIVGPGGEESDTVNYGGVAVLKIEDAVYYCSIDDPDAEQAQVMKVVSVQPMSTEMEDVVFQDEDDEDDDEEDEEDDDEGDKPAVVAVG